MQIEETISHEELLRKYAALRREMRWIRHLAANPNLAPADKWLIVAVRWKALDRKVSPLEPVKMFYEEDHTMVGLSTDTMGKRYKMLAENGVLERTVEVESNGRTVNKHITLGLTEQILRHPEKVFLNEPRMHGGKRVAIVCKDCGSEDMVDVITRVCRTCGVVHDKRIIELNEDVEEPIEDGMLSHPEDTRPRHSFWDGKEVK